MESSHSLERINVPEALTTISRIIEWHRTISYHIKLAGDSITDREALASLFKTRADWIPGQVDILAEKQKNVQRIVTFLGEGFRSHFGYEERVLPSLLGELFMRALVLDHQEVLREIDDAKTRVPNFKLEGSTREELLVIESEMQQMIDSISRMSEGHLIREEVVLGMLQRALQDKQQTEGKPKPATR